jgi:hypothetical protein
MCRKCRDGLPVGRSADKNPWSDAGRLTQVLSPLAKRADSDALASGSMVASSRVAVGVCGEVLL